MSLLLEKHQRVQLHQHGPSIGYLLCAVCKCLTFLKSENLFELLIFPFRAPCLTQRTWTPRFHASNRNPHEREPRLRKDNRRQLQFAQKLECPHYPHYDSFVVKRGFGRKIRIRKHNDQLSDQLHQLMHDCTAPDHQWSCRKISAGLVYHRRWAVRFRFHLESGACMCYQWNYEQLDAWLRHMHQRYNTILHNTLHGVLPSCLVRQVVKFICFEHSESVQS